MTLSPSGPMSLVRQEFLAMGTQVTVTVVCESSQMRSLASAAIADVQNLISDFGRDGWAWGQGALAQFNRRLKVGEVARIPSWLQPLLIRAWQIRQLSEGFFEPRIAALVHLWGFDDVARLRATPPHDDEIEQLLTCLRVAPDYLSGDTDGPAAEVEWDLGAIGKGYIVDEALNLLRSHGFGKAMIDAGGNLAVRGDRGGQAWRIGIRDPRAKSEGPQLLAALNAYDEAVITHGDDQRFFEHEGHRYSHILNPRTGKPAKGLRSLTVLHADATLADAAGAALFVAGVEYWPELSKKLGIRDVLVVSDDGRVQVTAHLLPRLSLRDDVAIEVIDL